MISAYTQEQFENVKNRDKLPCICEHCSHTFYTTKGLIAQELREKRGRVRFCNQKCHIANISVKARMEYNCAKCGKLFHRKASETKKHKIYVDEHFCSHQCANLFIGEKYKSENTMKMNYIKVHHLDTFPVDVSLFPPRMQRRMGLFNRGYIEAKNCTDPFMFLFWGLYWGEGGKTCHSFKLANMDVYVLQVMISGLINYYNADPKKLVGRIAYHAHKDYPYETIADYWKSTLNLPTLRLTKKEVLSVDNYYSDEQFKSHYGVFHLLYHSSEILFRILGSIKYLQQNSINMMPQKII